MHEVDDRTKARMGVILKLVCRELPNNGGDHESRKLVAERRLWAAEKGETTLAAVEAVARQALRELTDRHSA